QIAPYEGSRGSSVSAAGMREGSREGRGGRAVTRQRILVGVDGSEDAKRAVEWCAAFAANSEIEIVVCHVISKFGEWLMSVGQVDFQKIERERARLLQGAWTEPLRAAGVSYDARLIVGDPVKEILELADGVDAELVVIGRAGHGAAGEFLLGGRAAKLAH